MQNIIFYFFKPKCLKICFQILEVVRIKATLARILYIVHFSRYKICNIFNFPSIQREGCLRDYKRYHKVLYIPTKH